MKVGGFRLPILEGVLPIQSRRIPSEITAGVTLAALAIPEVMGYSRIAGMPVITGMYTILIPMVLFAVFGSSRHLVVGADSATAAILSGGLAGLAVAGSNEYVALASALALIAAGLLVLARLIGLAFMADFLSRTVLIGFLTGVGIQVALSQIPGMLGLPPGGNGTLSKISEVAQIGRVNFHALAIAVSVVLVIVGSKRLSGTIPGALLAVTGAIAASWVLGLGQYVDVLGPVPGRAPHIGLPQVPWNPDLIRELAPTAFAMFVVILAQSAATSRAYAARYDEHFNESTDLVGLGFANIGAALSGTFVVNGSPTKTQMVDSAGGRSQLSLLITAAIVMLVLLFLTGPLAYLPNAALSAVVFVIGIELIDTDGMRSVFAQRRSEFWVAAITASMVVLVGVEEGILLAIVLSLVDHTRRGYRPKNVVLAPSGSGAWRPQPVTSHAQAVPGLLIYRFTHSMYYANSQQLTNEISELVHSADPPLRWLCIDASAVDDVDYTAAEALRSLRGLLQNNGVRMVVAQLLPDVRERSRYEFKALLGEDAFYESLEAVMADYQRGAGGRRPPRER